MEIGIKKKKKKKTKHKKRDTRSNQVYQFGKRVEKIH